VMIGAVLLSGVGAGVTGIRLAGSERAMIASRKREQEMLEQEAKAPKLSVKDKLDNAHMQKLLTEHKNNDWSALSDPISKCIAQLEQMDDYQERLSRLLKNNGADLLYDTEDVLDRVEQYICKNVRKVLNYMDVADPKLPEDVDMLHTKLDDCHEKNHDQLRQTQEFIFALTDFLNQQGDSENDVSMLEIYKKTILDSINE
ncbi:MAG: hypothetical protein J6P60_02220, partial [Lachnospiraceae bacterium]|nr:hypothetical protein [Lachnospiraceae bacterium]